VFCLQYSKALVTKARILFLDIRAFKRNQHREQFFLNGFYCCLDLFYTANKVVFHIVSQKQLENITLFAVHDGENHLIGSVNHFPGN